MNTPEQLRRLNDQSRVRLAAVEDIREQCRLIGQHSRRRLDESRLLLAGSVPTDRV